MKRIFVIAFEIILCFVLQTSLAQYISLANIMPNLLLILTVSQAYMNGRMTGVTTGLFCGLLIDISFGNLVGLYAIIFMIIGYFNGYARKIYVHEDYTLPLLFIGASDIVYGLYYYFVEFLLRGRLNIFYYFRRIILPEVVYTIVAAIIFYKLFQWLDRLGNWHFKTEEA